MVANDLQIQSWQRVAEGEISNTDTRAESPRVRVTSLKVIQ